MLVTAAPPACVICVFLPSAFLFTSPSLLLLSPCRPPPAPGLWQRPLLRASRPSSIPPPPSGMICALALSAPCPQTVECGMQSSRSHRKAPASPLYPRPFEGFTKQGKRNGNPPNTGGGTTREKSGGKGPRLFDLHFYHREHLNSFKTCKL